MSSAFSGGAIMTTVDSPGSQPLVLSEDETQMTQEDLSLGASDEEGHIEDDDEEEEVPVWGRLVPLKDNGGAQHIDLTSAKEEYTIGRGIVA